MVAMNPYTEAIKRRMMGGGATLANARPVTKQQQSTSNQGTQLRGTKLRRKADDELDALKSMGYNAYTGPR